MQNVAIADRPDELHDPTSFITKYIWSQDHKVIAVQYGITAIFVGVIALILSAMMRLQLGFPDSFSFINPENYYQFVTMHGMIMVVYLLTALFLGGFGNYLIPLMVGARDMVFPYMNMLSFWVYLLAVLVLAASFFTTGGPTGAGWTLYPPQAITTGTPGQETGIVLMLVSLILFIAGFTMGGLNYVVTVLQARTRGMTLMRMPMLVWMMLVVGVLVLVAIPILTAAQAMPLFDRQLGAHFFNPEVGGSAILWQHLFWFFGHPEVYILILPAFGFISEIMPVFSRKVIFGYPLMVAATVGIGFISLGVWAHHMFTVGLGPVLDSFFTAATFLISVPTGIKIFNWLGTMWGGRLRFDTPMLFATGFVAMFIIGGLTGIMLATVPVDWQLSDSYFVVGHFHYVLFGGTVFGIFGALFYWFPKATGRLLDERLGKWTFWLLFIGFTLTFMPMHVSGVLGMPRRIYTYEVDRGFEIWNLISSIGVPIQGAGVLLFLWNVVRTLRRGEVAGDDPWDAWTLEWGTSSPPPEWNFDRIPTVTSARPLWDRKHPEDADAHYG